VEEGADAYRRRTNSIHGRPLIVTSQMKQTLPTVLIPSLRSLVSERRPNRIGAGQGAPGLACCPLGRAAGARDSALMQGLECPSGPLTPRAIRHNGPSAHARLPAAA